MTDIASLRRELLHRRIAASAARPASRDIERRAAAEAPLSHAQERLWFLEQLGLVGGSYNIGLAVRLLGRLDTAALEAALSEVVRRHEALRTRFVSRGEAAVQLIDPPWPVTLEPLAVAPDEAGERARAILQQRFDLAHDRLLRVALLRLDAEQHVLVLAMHHVVSDGWSIGVLVREVEALYAAFAQRRPSPLPELPVQYADYAVWQRRWLADGALERQLDYWTDQLAAAPAALELSTDRPRPAVPSFRGAVHPFTIDPARTKALANLARQHGATLFMLLLAAFQVLLARCSGQYDVVVGTPIAGRTRAETEGLIGFFVNMLALRSRLDRAASFRSVLQGVKAAALDAYAHQDLPFEKLVEALHPIRDLSREPIVQAVFALQNVPQQPARMAGLAIEPFDTGPVPAKFDLELSMVEADGALHASIVYATDLFDAATIGRLAGHFARLLDAIVADPECRIAELPLIGEAERRQLDVWSGTVAPYPEDRCLQDLFAAQVARTPDAPAVVCEDRTLSYRELDRRANRLAHHLRALGVGPDVVVGLCMTRSPDLVVGVLGILKAGGAYLPLDPTYPADRLAFMLADARVPILLTQSPLVDRLPVHPATLVQLDADAPQIARWPDTPPPCATDPRHLAYVIYTSGSTGRPKGVMIPHRGAMNLAEAQLTRLPLGPADRILQFASISFDAAVWDLLMAWRAGATLVLADLHDLMPGEPLRELITRQRITTVLLPPSALAALPVAELSCLTTLIVGGEACAAEQLRPWLAGRTVLNAYGPTEASVCTTLFDCKSDQRRPPIGRPLPNTRTHVLDQQLEPVPIGVAGELFIGGAGLARGYLARPALTAERFVPNPFAPGERLYRTGDRVRWRADGELEFLGRLDTQVKIRGFRIEPGEIEAALLAQGGIEHAVVIARDDAVGKRLVAYLVGRDEATADAGELRRKLQQSLPDYMVPAAFVTLDRLPLTPNGKLDRTALPAPEWSAGADYVAPRTPLETILAGLFAELLGSNRVGIYDNFFEAGGDSIQSIQLVARARAQGIAITPRQIFQHQTVAALAEVTGRSQAAPSPGDTAAAGPLTPIQQWFLTQPGPITHFNQAVLLEVPGDVKPALIERALAALVNHHDALRSRFVRDGSGWRQDYLPDDSVHVDFTQFHLADVLPEARIEQLQIAAARIQASLDPEVGRMTAAGWFDFGVARPGRLLLVIHHLAVDGISWRILLEDLITSYQQIAAGETIRLPAKTTSVTAWAARLAARARDPVTTGELAFWTAACHDAPALPRDRAVDCRCGTHGESETLTVSLTAPETQALLAAVPQAYRTRINDALLAALALGLADWRHARGDAGTSVLVDLEGHGREDLFPGVDLSRTVGWFTTMYPMRLDPGPLDGAEVAAGGLAAGVALRRIKEQLRAVPNNGIGWGLLRHLNPESAAQLQALPRPEIGFNYLGRFDEAGSSGWRSAAESPGASASPHRARDHLVEVVALVQGGALRTEWSWWPRAHDRASIADLAARATAALRGVIRHCTAAEAGGYTPSDFPLAELDEDRLAALQRRYPDMEDVWPLAPMQHEILRHARHAPDSRAGHHQLCLTLDGAIDAPALERAWHALPASHAALRIAIAEAGMVTHQVVRRGLQLPWRFADWSALPADVRERRLQHFLAQERTERFDLARDPLLRGGLLRSSPRRHMLVLSFHHILLDGWSMPILLRELLEIYQAARRGHRAVLPSTAPYRDYLAWLASVDRAAEEAFWRERLAGLAQSRLDLAAGDSAASPDALGEHCVVLSELSTSRLQAVAQARRLTMSTMVQGAWAMVLARRKPHRDVVFGMTTAGRPGDLSGIERMVGLCTNTLPHRVRLDPVARVTDWLGDLQARQAEEQTHAWCTLDDIRRWIGAPAGAAVFDSVVVFENYPLGGSLAGHADAETPDLTVSAVTSLEQGVHFPLCLVVGPGPRLSFRLAFGRRRFATEAIKRLADDFVQLLAALAADPDQSVSALWPVGGRQTTDQTGARVDAELGAS